MQRRGRSRRTSSSPRREMRLPPARPSSKPLVQGVTDVIWSLWLGHHLGDADGARVAIDMFSDGGVFYGGGVFEAGRWYPGRTQFARDPALAAMAFQRCSRTWAGGRGGPRGGSPVGRIADGGMAVGKVAGACSQGARNCRPEEWQRLEAIKERKKLRREANEKHEKKRCLRLEARRAFQPHRRGFSGKLTGERRGGVDDSAGELATESAALSHLHDRRRRRAQRRMWHVGRIACGGMAVGLCEALVAGARRQGTRTRSRHPEVGHRGEAIMSARSYCARRTRSE